MRTLDKNEMKSVKGGARVRCRPSGAGRDTYRCCAEDRPDWACWYQVDVN